MSENLREYIHKVNFKKQLKSLEKKLKNKKVVIYGAGELFKLINSSYDLSVLNIIGISDKRFSEEGKKFLDYDIIPFSKLKDVNADYILVSTLKYLGIIRDLENETLKGKNIKIIPLVKKQFAIRCPSKVRKIIYLSEFFRNLFYYANKKVEIEKLQIWTGQTCTLKCKNCSQLFPYIPPKLYDIDTVINDTRKVVKHCNVKSFHIIGGEPFTNKNIYRLIEYIGEVNPGKRNKIISNGTIIPNEKTIEMLKKYRDSIYITVSHYDCVHEKQIKFQELMVANGIKCNIINQDTPWFYCGDNNQKEITDSEIIERNFDACWDRTCYTIADGELSVCPRMHNSLYVFNESKFFIEYLPIKLLGGGLISRALVATTLTDKTYRESCRYCYGVSSINNIYCVRGEQIINQDNRYEKKL